MEERNVDEEERKKERRETEKKKVGMWILHGR